MEAISERIGRLRREQGLTQEQLAQTLGRDRTAISRIESGDRNVSAFELATIAEALHTSVRELLARQQPAPAMAVAYRVAMAAIPDHLQAARNRARRLFELDALLDGLGVSKPPRPELPGISVSSQGSPSTQGQQLAGELRRFLRLSNAPVPDLPEFLEAKAGVDIVLEPMPEDVSGLLVAINGAFLAMANSAFPFGRQRFTIAHELCHAICGDPEDVRVECDLDEPKSSEEIRANSFARHFLLPLPVVQSFRPRDMDDHEILSLMYGFGISLQALLFQLRESQLVDTTRANTLLSEGPGRLSYINGFRSEWTAAHRTCLNIRRPPSRLEIRCLAAYRDGLIGIGPVADLLGVVDAEALRAQLAHEGIASPAFEADLEALSV
jgi:Zn-dependent peptidase ImmA (M78 family)/transcriptional regulator with XRE-family HTH domain